MVEAQKFSLTKLDRERAVVTYLNVALHYKDRKQISYEKFVKYWNVFFEKGNFKTSNKIKRRAYEESCKILGDMPIEKIQAYRDSNYIYEGDSVPEYLLELARTKTKDLIICLAQNRNRNLSGFDILVKYNSRDSMRLNKIPFGLDEESAKSIIESLPIKSVLVGNEKKLMDLLKDENANVNIKRKAVQKYKARFATQEFRVFMNRFTMCKCRDKQLVNDCVNLCERVHIMNLSNMKPIKYEFCEGSGKREITMKKVKRDIKRGKKNKKSKK